MPLVIEQRPSPNFNSRGTAQIRVIVIHATAGTDSLAHLRNPAPGGKPERAVSAHDLIAKDGTIFHLVDYDKRAWHAGKSAIPGLPGDPGSLSIGIELENMNDGRDPYPAPQLAAAVELVRGLVAEFNIPRQYVVRHADIALPRGRKTDPQAPAFNMQGFLNDVFTENDQPGRHTTSLVVTHNGVNIRQGAGTDFRVIGQLNVGDVVRVSSFVDGENIEGIATWARLADRPGYVTMRFLRTEQ